MSRKRNTTLVKEQMSMACLDGIRYAIRLGDLPLAKFCFDYLWDSSSQSKFLWSLPLIFAEDCWYLMGELALITEQPFFSLSKASRESVWSVVKKATHLPKSKDAHALILSYGNPPRYEDILGKTSLCQSSEITTMKYLLWLMHDTSPERAGAHILDEWYHQVDIGHGYSDYFHDTLQFLLARISSGGSMLSLQLLIVVMALSIIRRVSDAEMTEIVEGTAPDEKTPKYSQLPWWCFLGSSVIGQKAESRLCKKLPPELALDVDHLKLLQFVFQTTLVDKDNFYTSDADLSKPWENKFWVPFARELVTSTGLEIKLARNLWNTKYFDRLREEVEIVLKSR